VKQIGGISAFAQSGMKKLAFLFYPLAWGFTPLSGNLDGRLLKAVGVLFPVNCSPTSAGAHFGGVACG
jgi:hypothetical protein